MNLPELMTDIAPRVVVAALAARVALEVTDSPVPAMAALCAVLLALIAGWPNPDEAGRDR